VTSSRSGGQRNAQSAAILIDFVSAKRRNMTSKAASRLQGRAKDLSATIECESVYHSFFEHRPTKDYDNFIKNFGQSNMAQARTFLSHLFTVSSDQLPILVTSAFALVLICSVKDRLH